MSVDLGLSWTEGSGWLSERVVAIGMITDHKKIRLSVLTVDLSFR